MNKRILFSAFLTLAISIGYAQGWYQQNSGTTNWLKSIFMSDMTHGWAVGNNGAIVYTGNGGTTWNKPFNYSAYFNSVFFIDNDHGWAVGNYDELIGNSAATKNPIAWWITADIFNSNLQSIFFINADTGWMVGSGGMIFQHTGGGGGTWTQQTSNITQTLNSVYFIDYQMGWAVGDSGVVLSTIDGGTTWNLQNSTVTNILESVSFADANNGWIAGANGTILNTNDGGANWNTQTGNTINWLKEVQFINATEGWIVGHGGTILHTTDGGANWASQSISSMYNLESVRFVDANNGWAAGGGGLIIHTTTGGTVSTEENNINPTHFECYPNPFATQTTIQYTLAKESNVTVSIHNIVGEEICLLTDKLHSSGVHQLNWDGNSASGKNTANGIYFCKVTIKNNNQTTTETKKIIKLK